MRQAEREQIHRLGVIADAQLAQLDAKGLLEELLNRVRELLDVDTVAVLVVDTDPRYLVAHIARGLEEEVRQGVRIPLGRGFAGRVAAERSPVILNNVTPDVVVNPILWRKGIRTLLGVPLLAAGELVGVMHVGRLSERQFDQHDVEVMQAAGDRIATAIATSRAAADLTAARTLQHSLLPSRVPSVPGLEFGARFIAAEDFGVGGDWYDAFTLPDGRIGVVIGDVAGRGLRAAVVMGRLRSALRAYAIAFERPTDVLASLNRKFSHFEPDEMATVLYGVIDPHHHAITLASAGHLPPVLAQPDSPSRFIDIQPGPPICTQTRRTPRNIVVELAPGTTLGFYTDGLIERRDRPITEGLERLRSAFYAGDVDDVCGAVVAELVGDGAVSDDIALLVLRVDNTSSSG